ncbi:BlaI/MecI/CopY family transcriptional regulator [Fulvivirgaceae bacterium PWU4]|uniref:BlaI/MecI/CopY family transcriptional regulator n=1 Tax=Chryseosolibacter histidini TaxID=2782349 RepID=A0AAP2GN97_9BACT|nr:BlaI/MecI/CopY family transcriptional regulator [Chryseosolibacter histidini]MBT1697793.1 BlaI/MecI/CopY family transcriptional regulator [Chryseosolibacter histidini]
MKDLKELTRAEDQVMQILWLLEKGFVKDIIEKMPEPKPAYNTVSTIVRILETKGFVGHKAYGKTHEYFPLISKEKYTRFYLNNLIKGYFNGSFQNLVSFFAKENKLNAIDIEKLLEELKNKDHEGDH